MPLKRYRWLRAHGRPSDALLLVAALVLGLSFTAQFWVPLLWPPAPPPFSYSRDPFPITPNVLHAGDTPDIEVGRCNNTPAELTYTIARIVQRVPSGEQWYLPTIGGTAMPGCAILHSRAHTLPNSLPPGTYRLYFVATVVVEGRGTMEAAGRTRDFRVVARPAGGVGER